jgi:hypothetical protein
MSVYVAGDTHIPIDIAKLNITNWPEQRLLTKNDLLIILGDCGILWANEWDKEELYWAKWLTAKKCTVCFIDGNHENFTRLNAVPEVEFRGAKAGLVYCDDNGSIYHLKRGEIYDFEGRKVLTVGGARSTDKAYRIPYKSWWPEEQLSEKDEKNIIASLESVNYQVDYILTHTCPTNIATQIFSVEIIERDKTVAMMDFMQKYVSRRQWHFGHFHLSRGFDGDYICHYNWSPYKLF